MGLLALNFRRYVEFALIYCETLSLFVRIDTAGRQRFFDNLVVYQASCTRFS